MKKVTKSRIFHFVFLITAFAMINAEQVSAYFYNIAYSCKNNICVEGEIATWHVTISNDGRHEIEFIAIEFFDVKNNSPFVSLKIPFYPLSDKRGNLIIVKPNEKMIINLTDKLPKSNYGQLFIYYPCFTTTITDNYIIARDNIYELTQCYNQNETMQIFECVSNDNCNKDEFCSFNKCLKLSCKSCQYATDHVCVDYECCSSEQCEFDEKCENNACKKLDCKFNEYVLNNTCEPLKCGYDEIIFNKTCIMLNCSYDESAFNHTCKKLNCSENEFTLNHTCKLLKCKKNEYGKNHTCNPLNCLFNETFFNHTCKPLNCWFFQDTINHACRNNKQMIFKLSLEVIAIIIIILFLILDFRKYGKKHKEKIQ